MVPFQVPDERCPATPAEHGAALALPREAGMYANHPKPDEHSHLLIDMLTQAVFETGAFGQVSEISPSWQAFTGQVLEEARGFGWLSALHPDDLATVIDARVHAMRDGTDLNIEVRLRRADGGWCWTNIRAVQLRGADGRIVKWVGMMIDISARREAEARLAELQDDYQQAVDLNPQMPWTAWPDGRIRSVSDRWCRFTGQTREQALAATPGDFAHAEDAPATMRAYRHSIATGDPLDARFRVGLAGGNRWIRARAWPRRDSEGKILRWYGVLEDVHESVLAEAEREAAEERCRLVVEATQDILWDFDPLTGIVSWNSAMATRFGHHLEAGRAHKRWWVGQLHPDDRARVLARSSEIFADKDRVERWTNEYRFARADGSYAHVLDRGRLIRDAAGTLVRAIGAMVDLTEKYQAEDILRIGEERLRLAVEASGLGIWDHDVRAGTVHWSRELRSIFGVDASEPANKATALALIHPEDLPEAAAFDQRALAGDFSHEYRIVRRIYRKNDGALRWVATEGHPIYDRHGTLVRVIVTAKDVTDEKTAQNRLTWTATHDAVTGLPNRAAFQDALDSALATAATLSSPVALLLFDLDNFKQINDNFGHHAGDLVLRTFGDRIGGALPLGGILARFGGDEFAVILPGIALDAATTLAHTFQARLRKVFALDGGSVDLRASIGIAAFPGHGNNAEDLVKSADIALYAAKDAGRSTVRVFEPMMRASLQEHASMLHQARTVVAQALTKPFYQPKISLESGEVTGLEALFRWHHPVAGVQSPATIAHAFDDFELAAVLGDTMVEAVLADIRNWLDAGVEIGRVAINTSAAEFRNPLYAERLLARLKVHNVPPAALELELT